LESVFARRSLAGALEGAMMSGASDSHETKQPPPLSGLCRQCLTSALVLMIVALLAGCLSARYQGPMHVSPQRECGMTVGADCEADQAICIAKTLLSSGESALRETVRSLTNEESHNQAARSAVAPVWAVFITTRLGPGGSVCGSMGIEVWVSRQNGQIIKSRPWEVSCAS
jgi:hypothetical protein